MKEINRRVRRDRRGFSLQRPKHKSFGRYSLVCAIPSSEDEEERMNGEEAESSREIVF
jgi:hypothetical protein